MEKLETFTEVLLSLKDKEVLTTNKKDRYILKKDKIYVYKEGTSFVLTLEDFRDLYQEKTFFVYITDIKITKRNGISLRNFIK